MYDTVGHPLVQAVTFECHILIEWTRNYQATFAAAPTRRSKILGSAPYWKVEKADSAFLPVELQGEFKDGYWFEARSIFKTAFGDIAAVDIPNNSDLSTAEEINAAQQHCTAIVENGEAVGKIQKYGELMERIRGTKREGEAVEGLEADKDNET